MTVHIGHRLDMASQRVAGRRGGGDPNTITLPEFAAGRCGNSGRSASPSTGVPDT